MALSFLWTRMSFHPSPQLGKGESGNADADTEVHDVVDAGAVGLQHGGELITRDELANGADPGVDNEVWSGFLILDKDMTGVPSHSVPFRSVTLPMKTPPALSLEKPWAKNMRVDL
jgi:hypothetical protein